MTTSSGFVLNVFVTCISISRYEDHGALEAGHDGLNVIKNILKFAPRLLEPNR